MFLEYFEDKISRLCTLVGMIQWFSNDSEKRFKHILSQVGFTFSNQGSGLNYGILMKKKNSELNLPLLHTKRGDLKRTYVASSLCRCPNQRRKTYMQQQVRYISLVLF